MDRGDLMVSVASGFGGRVVKGETTRIFCLVKMVRQGDRLGFFFCLKRGPMCLGLVRF